MNTSTLPAEAGSDAIHSYTESEGRDETHTSGLRTVLEIELGHLPMRHEINGGTQGIAHGPAEQTPFELVE